MLAELASTKRIVALGAMACAHSTSSEISKPQSALVVGSLAPPVWLTILKFAAGRPNFASKAAKSLAMFGSLYASTMAIVWPLPSPVIELLSFVITLRLFAR